MTAQAGENSLFQLKNSLIFVIFSLCREEQVNLAYRWFCKLGIEDAVPDHSAFSRARNERFREGDVFRRVFERVVETCIAAGLVGGEGFAVDGPA